MKTLWVIPTKIEGEEILRRFSWKPTDKHKYFLETPGKKITLLFSGTGSAALMLSLTEELVKSKPDTMLFFGFAGSYRRDLPLGSLVEVRENIFGDVGTSGKSLEQMGLPFSYKKTELNISLLKSSQKGLRELTYNKVSESFAEAEARKKRWNGDLESMEGAAFFVLGKYFEIPFRMFRAISNYAGERNKKNWEIRRSVLVLGEKAEREI